MKKIKRLGLILCMITMFVPNFKIVNATIISEVENFTNVQDRISELLTVDGNHYSYDKEVIEKLISTVNVDKLNSEIGSTYTEESLNKLILHEIDNYVVEFHINTRGTFYDRNYCTEGWNYNRWYTSKANTEQWIKELNSNGGFGLSLTLGVLALIPGYGALGIPALFGTLGDKWNTSFAGALQRENRPGGVVADVNKFTAIYSVTAQVNWYE